MSRRAPALDVTLSAELFDRLRAEAAFLGVTLEWVVAALVADTLAEPWPAASRR